MELIVLLTQWAELAGALLTTALGAWLLKNRHPLLRMILVHSEAVRVQWLQQEARMLVGAGVDTDTAAVTLRAWAQQRGLIFYSGEIRAALLAEKRRIILVKKGTHSKHL